MRGKFTHISRVVKTAREQHPKKYSQAELSHLMGYMNGQFISNVERALCSVPIKKVADLCLHLNLNSDTIKEAMMMDFSESFDMVVSTRWKTIAEVPNDATTHAQ